MLFDNIEELFLKQESQFHILIHHFASVLIYVQAEKKLFQTKFLAY